MRLWRLVGMGGELGSPLHRHIIPLPIFEFLLFAGIPRFYRKYIPSNTTQDKNIMRSTWASSRTTDRTCRLLVTRIIRAPAYMIARTERLKRFV